MMRCSVRVCSADSVIEAMARASRRAPKPRADLQSEPLPEAVSAAPRFLTPALQTFAQQQHQQQQQPNHRTFAAFIDAAQLASAASLARFQRSVQLPLSASTKEHAAASLNALEEKERTASPRLRDLPSTPNDAEEAQQFLAAAVSAFNPTLNAALLQRIASRLAITETLLLAKQLVHYLREAAAAAGHEGSASEASRYDPQWQPDGEATPHLPAAAALELLQRAMDVCRARFATSSASAEAVSSSLHPSPWELTRGARESAGIVARLHGTASSQSSHGQRRRRPLPSCFVRYASDVQINEVLRSGAVVVFTHPTHPEEVADRALASSLHGKQPEASASRKESGKRAKRGQVSFYASLECCLAEMPAEVHMHVVLHRKGVSMEEATARMAAATDGVVHASDVSVNVAVPHGDDCVVVQLASVRVALPPSLRGPEHVDDALQHCLHVARTLAHVNVLAREENEKDAAVALQLLRCHLHPCTAESHGTDTPPPAHDAPQLQYALLLRGFEQRGGPVDQVDRAALACGETVPNFFSPHHFGPASVPFFRTYHVAAALEEQRYAEAAAMMLCLACGTGVDPSASSSPLPPWLEHALHLLCSGEEREGAWQAWWLQQVPLCEQSRLRDAKAHLVWNALATCRLQELAAATQGRRDAISAATPQPGDFVQAQDGDAAAASPARVVPIFSQAEAARYTVHDIVLPLVRDAASTAAGCPSVAEAEALLGFPASRGVSRQSAVTFRPLLVSATGFPRSARPWARSFQEPASTALDVAGGASEATVFSLATDWELASNSEKGRDYAANSRGPRAQIWPLSKRGRSLSDRLPVGLLAAASADGSSLAASRVSAARRRTSRCLAIHCTLPADVSLGNYVSEFAAVEDLRAPS